MTVIRFATPSLSSPLTRALGQRVTPLLIAFPYAPDFIKRRGAMSYRDWALDSGAFTAHASGKPIRFDDYLNFAKHLWATDKTLAEVFALDVIGDWKAGLRNARAMRKAGVPCIPTWHANEPEGLLKDLAHEFPKIAVGGISRGGWRTKIKIVQQVFARVWPKPIHGFGFSDERVLIQVPFHSTDASSWETGPQRWGVWRAFPGGRKAKRLSVYGAANTDLLAEVDFVLNMERRITKFWKVELASLKFKGMRAQ
jgi:hypothetical protein